MNLYNEFEPFSKLVNSDIYNDFETFSKLVHENENGNVSTNKILGSLKILAIKKRSLLEASILAQFGVRDDSEWHLT